MTIGGKLDHKIDRCYALHGRPPKSIAVAQTALVQPSTVNHTSIDTPRQPTIFFNFLNGQNPNSTTSVAHSSTSFVGLTHSISLGPWVLDSGATNHITGNQSFFSSLTTTGYLPSVTMTNGYRVPSHGVGTIKFFSSLSIDNVLYVFGSPFNLFLYHLGNLLLVAGGFLLSKSVMLVLLIISKLVLWLRVIPKFLV